MKLPIIAALAVLAAAGHSTAAGQGLILSRDPSGSLATLSLNGPISSDNAFFQSLGTNGRSCASCHVADQAFSITPAKVRARFAATHGHDPIFAAVDGANCADAKPGDAKARSLLLQSGLIRIGRPLPANAQFTISVVHDPYGCAIVPDPKTGQLIVSVYRRPLPSTNLGFLSAVMFDGRETIAPLTNGRTFQANLAADLAHQVIDATLEHAQAANPPTDGQVDQIVGFELGLFTAQARDQLAGSLGALHAHGGPLYLSNQPYYPGINDSLGADPTGAQFDAVSMTLFSPWAKLSAFAGDDTAAARRAIAAGEALFDSAPLTIANVRGLNDNPALGNPESFVGHCSTCHDTPNVGNHSLPLALDIGTGHTSLPGMETDPAIAAGLAQLSSPNLPVYLIEGCPNPFAPGEPESFYTSDPGKALNSGQCSDFNRIKGPILRGLAARAPYFHNGAAANLTELVNFYNERFAMHLTDEQKEDLVAFLDSL